MKFIEQDLSSLSASEAYGWISSCVAPRPIAFVSTLSAEGLPNLAPFSYFMAGGSNPPSVAFSPTPSRNGTPKDTLRNIEETGEYVINVVTYAMREPMNETSAEFPHGVSEWEASGFTALPSTKIKPFRVAESPISLECRLHQIVRHGEGFASAHYVIGEVLCLHTAQEVLTDGAVDPRKVDFVSRLGGSWYARVYAEALFEMARPPRPAK